ncbi:ACS family glucarate transporter-like MFS transporter [Pseudomonas sp. JUb42]|jgi:ACS family glucarate transporter-like MFS transporter|uniref:MFS transporter n=1 Tax=Pseudomonas sp. JUb42 TaxID=2940611 RepID=UPI0021690594|nr:MFS transporter [Pseudomonas sp. JUb42]MCS3471469.1 ACS family glucarate transporter-like MFS transporter [Pseudomonas sp. JUb42]
MTAQPTRIRYVILLLLFLVTTINYADRAILSIVGSSMQKELGITPVQMGLLFSAFAWAYVLGQIPGGWLLDRFGTKRVYAWSIFLWSTFTILQATVGWYSVSVAIVVMFVLRFMVGLAESPSFPGNSRMAAAWFPSAERGTAAGIFTSAQYFATVLFAPIMGWIVYTFGWHYVFVVMGGLGVIMTGVWLKTVYSPKQHPRVNEAELRHIADGGGLIDMDQTGVKNDVSKPGWAHFKQLLTNRMMLGVFIGQYCINTLSYFFLTWFPVYLVQERGMSILKAGFIASIPAVCGFLGGVLGGIISDALIRNGRSLTFARKAPLVLGMLMSTTMVACNYVDAEWLIVAIMALAYFGKGFGAIGWAVVADTAPKSIAGLCGGLFNAFGNTAGITTPIIIGLIIQATGSFELALVFVAANAVIAMFCYLVVVGKIQRMDLKQDRHTPPLTSTLSS